MRARAAVMAGAICLGALAGVGATSALTAGDAVSPPRPSSSMPNAPPDAPPTAEVSTLLVWMQGGLPPEVAGAVAEMPGVIAVSAVRAGMVDLTAWNAADGSVVDHAPSGMTIPLEVIAFDASTYDELLPAAVRHDFAELGPAEAILGETSARLRRIGSGGRLELDDGSVLTVAAVVDDALVGAAEVAVTVEAGARLGVSAVRYLLVAHTGERSATEQAIREELPPDRPARVRAPAETPFLRHGDAVLPQVLIKQQFGEFAYRRSSDDTFEVDAAWESENLLTTELPLVGRLRCHRQLIAPLAGALGELQERNLGYLVRPDGFAGCWNPRFIAGADALSRHAWGVAVDINSPKNPTGLGSVQDPRLIEVMEAWGFTWGGRWLVPDPAHFEYVSPPR